MGDPQAAYPVILVAGSNGKTSTTRMISALLTAHGLRVGSFTSPHLEVVEERLALDNDYATREDFAQAVADIEPFVALYEERHGTRLTYFELTTVLAYAFCAGHAVDAAVIEVGMGGRLDATNVAEAAVAVLTGVSMEHADILGNSLSLIAAEKVAIAEPGGVLVSGRLPEEAASVVASHVGSHDVEWYRLDAEFSVQHAVPAVGGWATSIDGAHATYDGLYLPLHGRHQVSNLAVALAATEALFGRALDPSAVQAGAAAVTVPGRLETLGIDPLVVVDGGHNPEGVAVAADGLADAFGERDWTVVLGSMQDKDLAGIVAGLADVAERVVTTAVDHPRAADPHDLAEVARRHLAVPVEVGGTVAAALELAQRRATDDGAVLVIGSLYLAGEARRRLRGEGRSH